jgi:hypothetical protein
MSHVMDKAIRVLLVGFAVVATSAAAQDAGMSRGLRDVYGLTTLGIKWLSAQKFLPMGGNAPLQYEASNFWTNPGSASPQRYAANLDEVPTGAIVHGLTCVFRDTSMANGLNFGFERATQDFPTGASNGSRTTQVLASAPTAADAPGIGYLPLSVVPPETIRVLPVPTQVTQYNVTADVASDTSFAGCAVFYALQLAPAPSVASFTDVPVGHPFFQVIEALKAAGITAGCTATEFCPDAPVTRAAMAAFLARALGLFFPF